MRLLLSALCCVLLSLVKGGGGTAPQDASSTSCSPDNIPDTGVLLDSRNYDTLGGVWTANDGPAGDSNTWVLNSPSTCNDTWTYCGAATPDTDLLSTQMIDPTMANGQPLTVELEFEFNFTGVCDQQEFQVLTAANESLANITCTSASPRTFMYDPDPPMNFQLMFQASFTEGTCVTLYRVRVYYSTSCAMQTIDHATYPMTNHNQLGMGRCVSNSDLAVGSTLMLTCRDGTFTDPLSAGGCDCHAGYGGATGTECTACPPGTYKFASDDTMCLPCPTNSNAMEPASNSCQCDSGYRRANVEDTAAACSDCAADFLRSSGMCEACPTDSFRTIGMFEASCTCQDSRTISDGDTATTGDPCDGCTTTHYRDGNNCTMCPTDSMANGAADTQCTCIGDTATSSGMTMTTTEPCGGCRPTHYLAGGTCMACPANSMTTSATAAQCTCIGDRATSSGMTTTTTEPCGGCADGLYIPSGGVNCTQCPDNSNRMDGDSSRCVCDVGWVSNNGLNVTSDSAGCTGCAANYRRSAAMCVQCPANSLTTIGRGETTCTCQSNRSTSTGNTMTSGDACDACGADFYVHSNGSCVACPANSMRMSGSAESGCSCRPGYIAMSGAMECYAVIGFTQTSLTVSESSGSTMITVQLSAEATTNVGVTSDINSAVGTVAPPTLDITSGTTRTITAVINDNADAQMQDAMFTISLSSASGLVQLGGMVGGTQFYQNLSVTVQDDEITPGPPTDVAGSVINSTAVQLTWQAPANSGSGVVTNYIVTYRVSGSSQTTRIPVSGQTFSLTVDDLQPETVYMFSVSAVTTLGESSVMSTTVTTPATPVQPTPFPLAGIIGIAVGGAVLAILILLIILVCVIICRIRVNRRGFYPTYEDKASEPPTMLRYSASLRSISSQTVVPSDARITTKENEFYV